MWHWLLLYFCLIWNPLVFVWLLQIVTSPITELPSVITLPMLVTEHESSLDHFVEIHDRSAMARRNLETIVKAIYHVEGSDSSLAEKMQESFGADGLEQQEQPERSLRFCIPSSLTRQPLVSVPDVGLRSLESGARIPMTLNAVSILLSSQRSSGDASVFIQPVLTEKLSWCLVYVYTIYHYHWTESEGSDASSVEFKWLPLAEGLKFNGLSLGIELNVCDFTF